MRKRPGLGSSSHWERMELHTMLVEKCLRFRTLMLRSSVEKLSIQRDAEMRLLERSAHTKLLGKLMRNHFSTRIWRAPRRRHVPRPGEVQRDVSWKRPIEGTVDRRSRRFALVRA